MVWYAEGLKDFFLREIHFRGIGTGYARFPSDFLTQCMNLKEISVKPIYSNA